MPCDTCFAECPFFGKRDTCPNHMVTAWKDKDGQTKLVHDCAPRRTMLMQLEISEQLLASRQEVARLQHSVAALATAVENSVRALAKGADFKQIE